MGVLRCRHEGKCGGSIDVIVAIGVAHWHAKLDIMRTYNRPTPIADIFLEYLEEAAFLYGVRRRWFSHSRQSWEDLWQTSRRLQRHLHGLTLGGRATVELLREKLTLDEKGDAGEAFTAAAVYPCLDLVEPMQWLTSAIAGNPPHLPAMIDGLAYVANTPFLDPWIDDYLTHPSSSVRAAAVHVIGLSNPSNKRQRLQTLVATPADHMVWLAALSYLDEATLRAHQSQLKAMLNANEPALVRLAAQCLVSIGDMEIVHWFREQLMRGGVSAVREWSLLLAVTGAMKDTELFAELLRQWPDEPMAFLALGLLGNASTVDLLIEALSRAGSIKAFQATNDALRTITGMDQWPDFDWEEAEPETLTVYENQWKAWWEGKRREISSKVKWRRGLPVAPPILVQDVLRPGNPHRYASYQELRGRYRCPVELPFHGEENAQLTQLATLSDWGKTASSQFRPGELYWWGRPQ